MAKAIPAQHIPAIEMLRALACLLVVYCHLVGRPVVVMKDSWLPHTLISEFITIPLGIIQNFGFLGVSLFFLISGFIVTHTGLLETRMSFLAKRLFRIYPALFVAVGATVLLASQAAAAGWTDPSLGIGHTNALLSALGMDTGFTGQAVLGVGWTITIELIFYAHILALLPLLKRHPCTTVFLFIVWSAFLVHLVKIAPHALPMTIRKLSNLSVLLPIFAIGMTIYFYWSKRASLTIAAVLGLAAWIALILNMQLIHPENIAIPNSRPTQVFYALSLFLVALWIYGQREIKNHPFIKFFADISYSLYLVHLPFGVAVTKLLYPKLGLSAAIICSVTTAIFLAYLMYRFIERPAQKMGRHLLGASSPSAKLDPTP